jgi:PRA1 family protein
MPAPKLTSVSTHDAGLVPDPSVTAGSRFIPHSAGLVVEAGLSNVGSSATRVWSWATERGAVAVSHARPWLEFFDLSAFGLAEGVGLRLYIDRLRINVPYFLFNYVIFGLVLGILTTITQPLVFFGSFLIIVAYFHLFGSSAPAEVPFMGLSLDKNEKVGALVLLALFVIWFTAGGLSAFVTIALSTIFIALVHGSFRKPPAHVEQLV